MLNRVRCFRLSLFVLPILLACAMLPNGTPPTPSPPPAPAPTTTPTQVFKIPAGVASVRHGLEGLQSYRARLTVDFDGARNGQPAGGSLESLVEITRQPPAQRRYLQVETLFPRPELPAGVAELIRVENKTYVKTEASGTWLTFSDAAATPAELGFFELDRLILLPLTVSGPGRPETFNGQNVLFYTFDETDLAAPNLTVEKAAGEMWVAIPEKYLVRYAISATLRIVVPDPTAHLLDEGQMTLRYTLSDVNAGFTITPPPAEVQAGNLLLTLPRLPDAEMVSVFPTLVEYTSAITPLEAVLFYREELDRLEWAEEAVSAFNEKAEMTFAKEDQAVTVLIQPSGRPDRIEVLLYLVTAPH